MPPKKTKLPTIAYVGEINKSLKRHQANDESMAALQEKIDRDFRDAYLAQHNTAPTDDDCIRNDNALYTASKVKRTGREIAIKKIKVGQFKDGLDMSAIREIKFLRELRHENIIEVRRLSLTSPIPVPSHSVPSYCPS